MQVVTNPGHYEIIDDDLNHLVRITAAGEFDIELAKKMVANARAKSATRNYPLLYDLREVETSICESELYELLHSVPALKTENARRCGAAILMGKAIPGHLKNFYESEARNVRIPVRAFYKLDLALQWLHGRPCRWEQGERDQGQV